MPTNEGSVRLLTNAIFVPSGDHTGFTFTPHALINGVGRPAAFGRGATALERCAFGAGETRPAAVRSARYEYNCPSFENATAGVCPSPTSRAPPPLVRAAHRGRSAPVGALVGFATQPSRFGCVPRTNV